MASFKAIGASRQDSHNRGSESSAQAHRHPKSKGRWEATAAFLAKPPGLGGHHRQVIYVTPLLHHRGCDRAVDRARIKRGLDQVFLSGMGITDPSSRCWLTVQVVEGQPPPAGGRRANQNR